MALWNSEIWLGGSVFGDLRILGCVFFSESWIIAIVDGGSLQFWIFSFGILGILRHIFSDLNRIRCSFS